MCCLPPASSSTPLRPSVYNASIILVVNIINIRTFCYHVNIIYIFDQTDMYRFEVRLELYGAPSTARMPHLVRRVDPLFLPPPCLASLFLPFRILLPPLPHFLRPASLPPSFSSIPSSIFRVPSPSRRFGSNCKACSSYVIFIWFKYKMPTRLVHSVCQPLPRKMLNE